jgi:nucleoside-diphosphate-sugar epimerase
MIGSHLVALLKAVGAKILVIDNLRSGHRNLVPKGPSIKFIRGNINNAACLKEAFSWKPEFVFHLAALFANQNSIDHPVEDLRVNGMGTLQLLEKAHASGIKRFVYTSSSSIYSSTAHKMKETIHESSVSTPYAISKLLGERYCLYFQQRYAFPVTILRYFNSYGPHEYPGVYRNVIPNFFSLAFAGKPLPIHGDGRATRDFTYVGDTAEATALAAICEKAQGQIINIGTGKETSIGKLASMINQIAGNPAGIQFLPSRNWDLVKKRRANVARAKKLIGFTPRWHLRDGLLKTHAWLRTELDAK